MAAVEMVGPANEDRPDTRDRFVQTVAALSRQDVSVAVVDPREPALGSRTVRVYRWWE